MEKTKLWVALVIKSCLTKKQLEASGRLVELYEKKQGRSDGLRQLLKSYEKQIRH